MKTFEEVTFRSLKGTELAESEQLLVGLRQAGWEIPYTHLAEPIIAEYRGEIVGFSVAQLLPHNEPMWVRPDWRGTGLAGELARRTVEIIEQTGAKSFCCVAGNSHAEEICRSLGMREVPGKLFVKQGG